MNTFLSTQELETHIRNTYAKVEPYARRDEVYAPLTNYFAKGTPGGQPGSFCYADDDGYHFCSVERGIIHEEKTTQNLTEITYWVLEAQIFEMAAQYERQHRINHQDVRRIIFSKELQYLNFLGREYGKIAELEFNHILSANPFQD